MKPDPILTTICGGRTFAEGRCDRCCSDNTVLVQMTSGWYCDCCCAWSFRVFPMSWPSLQVAFAEAQMFFTTKWERLDVWVARCGVGHG